MGNAQGAESQPAVELGENEHEVRLSVYRLPYIGRVGGYHSGVVIRKGPPGPRTSVEFAFGAADHSDSGVYTSLPERDANPQYTFYKSIHIGVVKRPFDEVERALKQIANDYKADEYTLTGRNCNHFTSDVCWALLQVRIPEWINSLADGLEASARRNTARAEALQQEEARFLAELEEQAALERKALTERLGATSMGDGPPPSPQTVVPDNACLLLLYLDKADFAAVFGRVWDASWGKHRGSFKAAMVNAKSKSEAAGAPFDRVASRLLWEDVGFRRARDVAGIAARKHAAAIARAAVRRSKDAECARAASDAGFDQDAYLAAWNKSFGAAAEHLLEDAVGTSWLKKAVTGVASKAIRKGASAIGLDDEVFDHVQIDDEYLAGQWDEAMGNGAHEEARTEHTPEERLAWLELHEWEEKAWIGAGRAAWQLEMQRAERIARLEAANRARSSLDHDRSARKLSEPSLSAPEANPATASGNLDEEWEVVADDSAGK